LPLWGGGGGEREKGRVRYEIPTSSKTVPHSRRDLDWCSSMDAEEPPFLFACWSCRCRGSYRNCVCYTIYHPGESDNPSNSHHSDYRPAIVSRQCQPATP